MEPFKSNVRVSLDCHSVQFESTPMANNYYKTENSHNFC